MNSKRKHENNINDEPDKHDVRRRRIEDDTTVHAIYITIISEVSLISGDGLEWIGGDVGQRYLLGVFVDQSIARFIMYTLNHKARDCDITEHIYIECVPMELTFFNGSGIHFNRFYTHAIDNMDLHISPGDIVEYLRLY